MFHVVTLVTIHPTAKARQALGPSFAPAGLLAWREIARSGRGLEFAHPQFSFAGVTLAVSSRPRADGLIAIGLGLGDPRQTARTVTAAGYRRVEDKTRHAGGRRWIGH